MKTIFVIRMSKVWPVEVVRETRSRYHFKFPGDDDSILSVSKMQPSGELCWRDWYETEAEAKKFLLATTKTNLVLLQQQVAEYEVTIAGLEASMN